MNIIQYPWRLKSQNYTSSRADRVIKESALYVYTTVQSNDLLLLFKSYEAR